METEVPQAMAHPKCRFSPLFATLLCNPCAKFFSTRDNTLLREACFWLVLLRMKCWVSTWFYTSCRKPSTSTMYEYMGRVSKTDLLILICPVHPFVLVKTRSFAPISYDKVVKIPELPCFSLTSVPIISQTPSVNRRNHLCPVSYTVQKSSWFNMANFIFLGLLFTYIFIGNIKTLQYTFTWFRLVSSRTKCGLNNGIWVMCLRQFWTHFKM